MDIPRENQAAKKRNRLIAMSLAAAVAVGGLLWFTSTLEPRARSVERETVWIEAVKRGEMLRQVRGPGRLVPEDIQWITASTDGIVERRVILPGAVVSTDSIILELSNPELEQEAQNARLDLDAAEAGSRDLDVRLQSELLSDEAGLARVRSDFESAELEARAQEELAKDGLTPDITLRQALLRAKQLSEQVKIEEKRIEKKKESIQAQLASQRSRLAQMRAVHELRQQQLDRLRVRAGIAGVLQQIPVEVGQRVTQGTNLALVADPARLKAELQIPQVQAKDLVGGQPAQVDTRNGIVAGKVKRIDPSVRDGAVTIDVELLGALPPGARPDLSVEGTVEIERLSNVLYVGRPAYGQADSQVELFKVQPNGIAVRVPVKLGRSSVNTIEIVEGLEEGDQVILSETSAWDGEDRIRLE